MEVNVENTGCMSRLDNVMLKLEKYRVAIGPASLTEVCVAWTRLDHVRLYELAVDALHDIRVRGCHERLASGDPQLAEILFQVEKIIAVELIPDLWSLYEHAIRDKAAITDHPSQNSSPTAGRGSDIGSRPAARVPDHASCIQAGGEQGRGVSWRRGVTEDRHGFPNAYRPLVLGRSATWDTGHIPQSAATQDRHPQRNSTSGTGRGTPYPCIQPSIRYGSAAVVPVGGHDQRPTMTS